MAVEASVDDLLRIIGEQTVQIRLLERDQVKENPLPEPYRELHPVSDEDVEAMIKTAR
jgi:hypothetical protein